MVYFACYSWLCFFFVLEQIYSFMMAQSNQRLWCVFFWWGRTWLSYCLLMVNFVYFIFHVFHMYNTPCVSFTFFHRDQTLRASRVNIIFGSCISISVHERIHNLKWNKIGTLIIRLEIERYQKTFWINDRASNSVYHSVVNLSIHRNLRSIHLQWHPHDIPNYLKDPSRQRWGHFFGKLSVQRPQRWLLIVSRCAIYIDALITPASHVLVGPHKIE